jgi:hypothetical protein
MLQWRIVQLTQLMYGHPWHHRMQVLTHNLVCDVVVVADKLLNERRMFLVIDEN